MDLAKGEGVVEGPVHLETKFGRQMKELEVRPDGEVRHVGNERINTSGVDRAGVRLSDSNVVFSVRLC